MGWARTGGGEERGGRTGGEVEGRARTGGEVARGGRTGGGEERLGTHGRRGGAGRYQNWSSICGEFGHSVSSSRDLCNTA